MSQADPRRVLGVYLESRATDGGVYQYSRTLLEAALALPRERYEVRVAWAEPVWLEHLAGRDGVARRIRRGVLARAAGRAWRTFGLPAAAWRRLTPLFHPVARGLRSLACDLWIFPAQDTWAYQAPVEYAYAIHDLMHRYERRFPEVSAEGRYAWRENLYSQSCRWARAILVDSRVGAAQVAESYGVDPARIHVLPYIVPPGIARDPPASALAGLDLPPRFLFYPAQFWSHKNHENLLLALQRFQDAHLVLVGSGRNYPLEDRVRALGLEGRVHLLARALVMPTFFGPTNIPPLEAFSHGCPVAISDIYGMREQLGEAALYFDPLSPDEIADAIARLWTDEALRRRLAEAGRERARGLDQASFDRRLLDILDRIEWPAGTSHVRR